MSLLVSAALLPWAGGLGYVPAPLCTPTSPPAKCREGWFKGSQMVILEAKPVDSLSLSWGVPAVTEQRNP